MSSLIQIVASKETSVNETLNRQAPLGLIQAKTLTAMSAQSALTTLTELTALKHTIHTD